jgi:hypothetical protein
MRVQGAAQYEHSPPTSSDSTIAAVRPPLTARSAAFFAGEPGADNHHVVFVGHGQAASGSGCAPSLSISARPAAACAGCPIASQNNG